MAGRGASDEELFEAYVGGDRTAFAELVTRWTPSLRSILRRAVPEGEVDEIVQDAFLQLHRSACDFRPGARLRPWLLTIAFNLRRDHARRTWRRRDGAGTPPPPEADHVLQPPVVEQQQDRLRVRAALATLPAGQRKVIELHWFADLTFPEIARRVGSTAGAVKVRAYRGYERLRALLSDEAELRSSA
jgi:RNA polymerase sigma-70 factor, ECF subfamily